MNELICRIKQHIQPFERRLALQEIEAIAGADVRPVDGDFETASVFQVTSEAEASTLSKSLAYWHSIADGDSDASLTKQLRIESTANTPAQHVNGQFRTEKTSDRVAPSVYKGRRLRYGTHGLHEYRGKFFPQLVRAAMNIARLPDQSIILDPMCGSGTTLVEARSTQRVGYGLDMNPLSVFITNTKCQALELTPKELGNAFTKIEEGLRSSTKYVSSGNHFSVLAEHDQSYLDRWFPPLVLTELGHISHSIGKLEDERLKNFYKVCMSNIIRSVSHQKDDDLRVRRKESDISSGETTSRFLKEADRSTRIVSSFLSEQGPVVDIEFQVSEADARKASRILRNLVGSVDAVITSPPYATALPYIDTDRLSLIILELLSRNCHRERDSLMIGNREVTSSQRTHYWQFYEANRSSLPECTASLIDQIEELNQQKPTGFRRKNLSALLSKYFFDMYDVLQEILRLLRPGGTLFLVVGNNRTVAGGQPIEIKTADHLEAIATSLGLLPAGRTSMDMLAPRGIFGKNAVPSEYVLRLRKPQ